MKIPIFTTIQFYYIYSNDNPYLQPHTFTQMAQKRIIPGIVAFIRDQNCLCICGLNVFHGIGQQLKFLLSKSLLTFSKFSSLQTTGLSLIDFSILLSCSWQTGLFLSVLISNFPDDHISPLSVIYDLIFTIFPCDKFSHIVHSCSKMLRFAVFNQCRYYDNNAKRIFVIT